MLVLFIFLSSVFSLLSWPSFSILSSKRYMQLEMNSFAKGMTSNNAAALITDVDYCKMKIREDRWITTGDYVTHIDYGIGQFIGIKLINLGPTRKVPTWVPGVVIKFADAEIVWFKQLAEQALWLYRFGGSGVQDTSYIFDTRKWRKRKIQAQENSKGLAINLIKMTAIRNGYHRSPCIPTDEQYKEFENRFTFEPTVDQVTCFKSIEVDMVYNTRPMDRLVCGDVGFGKTEVAMRAIYRAVLSNRQVALLAPTRILALQHLRVLRNRMPDVNVQLLRGGGKDDAKIVKEALKDGSCQVVVGTHALLQPTVTFENLKLLVIDEEQRFGVGHKEKLKAISSGTDVLTLSATPIPRTLQMSLSGMKEFSQMTTPPEGRKEVLVEVSKTNMTQIVFAINREVQRKGQVFIVVPFIKNVAPIRMALEDLMPSLTFLEAHGECDNLEDRIDAFADEKAEVLVATTVIENGIDMPNVNTIIVLDADRFGMSALYQLRGRVGRSKRQAYAYFMTTNNSSITVEAETRLNHLKTFTALGSGYDLSRRDMEMRGYGTIFGSEQSGSKDVGQDLQSEILKEAVENLKKEFILSVPEARISLNSTIENVGISLHGGLPSSTDLMAVARWEASLSRSIISMSLKSLGWTDVKAIESKIREFLSCGTLSEQIALGKRWKSELGDVPTAMQELMKRSLLRIACRRLSIFDVRVRVNMKEVINKPVRIRVNPLEQKIDKSNDLERSKYTYSILMNCASIDGRKWDSIKASIPEKLQDKIAFVEVDNNALINSNDSVNIHHAQGYLEMEMEMELQGNGGNGIPGELLQVLASLAKTCEKKLEDAITSCDSTSSTTSSNKKKDDEEDINSRYEDEDVEYEKIDEAPKKSRGKKRKPGPATVKMMK